MGGTDLLERIRRAFPAEVVPYPAAPHRCADCDDISRALDGRTWIDVPCEFVDTHDDAVVFLSPAAYVAYLPAWLSRAVAQPDNRASRQLIVHLGCERREGFSSAQAALVVEAARYALEHGRFEMDEVDADALERVESTWGRTGGGAV